MFQKLFNRTIFAVLFVLVVSSVALALPPDNALSARTENALYSVIRVNDLNGLLKGICSPANIELLTSTLPPSQVPLVGLVASFVPQIPANTLIVAFGMDGEGLFVQAAASMPDSVRSRLDKVANGSAEGADIATLLMGDGGLMFAEAIQPDLRKGDKGTYYSLQDQVVFTAKDDLLLIASTPAALEASVEALENEESRLVLKRRFDSPNYLYMNLDLSIVLALVDEAAQQALTDEAAQQALADITGFAKNLKAPLIIETGLTVKPESYLFSSATNVFDVIPNFEFFKDKKPVKGSGMFMTGGGKMLLAIATPLLFNKEYMMAFPESAEIWNQMISALENIGITESDVESMLDCNLSLVLGSEASALGMSIPGGYIAITGLEGVFTKLFEKLLDNEQISENIPIIPLKVEGWDSLYTLSQAAVPVSLVFGTKEDTLFVGILNPDALDKKPELNPEIAKLLDTPLFGVGAIDFGAIWSLLRNEINNPASLIAAFIDEPTMEILTGILEAELSIPLVKLWSTELDTGFLEFSVVDVPQEKRLLPRVVNILKMFNN